jgi:hypothetical protein
MSLCLIMFTNINDVLDHEIRPRTYPRTSRIVHALEPLEHSSFMRVLRMPLVLEF